MPLKDDIEKLTPYFYRRPSHPYPEKLYPRYTNDFVNGIAGFEDTQSNPYSFGASPGGFSLSVPSGGAIYSQNHHLVIQQGGSSSGNTYVDWTDATGNQEVWIMIELQQWTLSYTYYPVEVRWWGVASPSPSDPYFAVRFAVYSANEGLRAKFYYGTGYTFTISDGTDSGFPSMILPYDKFMMRCRAYTGNVGHFEMRHSELYTNLGSMYKSGYGFTGIKKIRIATISNTYGYAKVDWIKVGSLF